MIDAATITRLRAERDFYLDEAVSSAYDVAAVTNKQQVRAALMERCREYVERIHPVESFRNPMPVLNEDGKIRDFMPTIGGHSFYCKCGANVFQKPDDQQLDLYECNGCGELYRGK